MLRHLIAALPVLTGASAVAAPFQLSGTALRPVEVFDQGERTYIRLSEESVLPAAIAVVGGVSRVWPLHRAGNGYVVADRWFDRLELVSGSDRATIRRTGKGSAAHYRFTGASALAPDSVFQRGGRTYLRFHDPARLPAITAWQGDREAAAEVVIEDDRVVLSGTFDRLTLTDAAMTAELRLLGPWTDDPAAAGDQGGGPWDLPPSPLKRALAAVAARHGYALRWEGGEMREAAGTSTPLPLAGQDVAGDLRTLEEAMGALAPVVAAIDVYEADRVIAVRTR